jgi:hypothetical protein
LFRKLEGKKAHGRPRRRWENNIRMDLRETGWVGVDGMHMVQNKVQWRGLVNVVKNLRFTIKGGKFLD